MPMEELPAPPQTLLQPAQKEQGEPGLLKKLFTFLFEKKEEEPVKEEQPDKFKKPMRMRHAPPGGGGGRRKGGGRHYHRGGRRDRDRGGRGYGGGGGHRAHDNRNEMKSRDNRPPRSREHREHQQQQTEMPNQQQRIQNHDQQQLLIKKEEQNFAVIPFESAQKPVEISADKKHIQEQATGTGTEKMPKRHAHPPRHRSARQYAAKQDQQGEKRHPQAGEDIYSSNKNEDDQ